MSTRYLVEIDLTTRGDFGLQKITPKMAAVDRGVTSMTTGVSRWQAAASAASHKVGVGLMRVGDRALEVGASFAKWGAAGAVAGVTYGVAGLNAQLEKTQISLGAIFTANNQAGTLQGGLELASSTIKDMRRDAAALPGEFGDLLQIMTTSAIPAFQAGADVNQHRQMSAKLMAAGVVASLPLDMVARESAQLLQGRAGAHNVLGMRLMGLHGDSAKEFNQLAAADRMAKMNSELDKYAGSIDVFKGSWEGLSSTFIDNAKELARVGSEPLFKKAKEALRESNRWLEDNDALAKSWAQRIGSDLVSAYDAGAAAIDRWGPAVSAFADNAAVKVRSIWEDIEPTMARVGETIREAFKDPGTLDKWIFLAKIYSGAKVAGPVGAAVMASGLGDKAIDKAAEDPGLLTGGLLGIAALGQLRKGSAGRSVVSGAWSLGQKAAGAVQSFRAAGAVSSGMTALSGGGAAAAGTAAGGAAAGTALTGLAVTAGAAASAFGGLYSAYDQGKQLVAEVKADREADVAARKNAFERTLAAHDTLAEGLAAANVEVANFRERAADLQAAADRERAASNDRVALWYEEQSAGAKAAAEIFELGIVAREARGGLAQFAGALTMKLDQQRREIIDPAVANLTLGTMKMLKDKDAADAKKKHGPKHPGGGGGTRIQKVEIVVTGNAEPARVARLVKEELVGLNRHRKTSPDVPNFSALRF